MDDFMRVFWFLTGVLLQAAIVQWIILSNRDFVVKKCREAENFLGLPRQLQFVLDTDPGLLDIQLHLVASGLWSLSTIQSMALCGIFYYDSPLDNFFVLIAVGTAVFYGH